MALELIGIIFSVIGIIILFLGYLDNRKNIKILLGRENERLNIKNVSELLKEMSELLKGFPDFICFPPLYFICSDICKEVYENGSLNLKIEFQYIVNSRMEEDEIEHEQKLDIDFINIKSIGLIVKKFHNWRTENRVGSSDLFFQIYPDVVNDYNIGLSDFFFGLSEIEEKLDELKKFEYLISSFDSSVIKTIEKTYQEILELFTDSLQKKVYELELNQNMKPSEIKNEITEILNYNQIYKKVQFMSTKASYSVDELGNELMKQFLTM